MRLVAAAFLVLCLFASASAGPRRRRRRSRAKRLNKLFSGRPNAKVRWRGVRDDGACERQPHGPPNRLSPSLHIERAGSRPMLAGNSTNLQRETAAAVLQRVSVVIPRISLRARACAGTCPTKVQEAACASASVCRGASRGFGSSYGAGRLTHYFHLGRAATWMNEPTSTAARKWART